MKTTITVRSVDPSDKFWLQREAKAKGVSMEELVRRLIHEKRQKSEARQLPSEVFRHFFGQEHGIELPSRSQYNYQHIEFADVKK